MRCYALEYRGSYYDFSDSIWRSPNHITCNSFLMYNRESIDIVLSNIRDRNNVKDISIKEFGSVEEAKSKLCE